MAEKPVGDEMPLIIGDLKWTAEGDLQGSIELDQSFLKTITSSRAMKIKNIKLSINEEVSGKYSVDKLEEGQSSMDAQQMLMEQKKGTWHRRVESLAPISGRLCFSRVPTSRGFGL